MGKPRILWLNFLILTLTPLTAVTMIPYYAWRIGFDLFDWIVFGLFMIMTGLSITGGYHRLWSHKSYNAHWLMRLFYAVWGACGLQNSILHWSSDHRRHHKYVDQNDKDPYSAGRGFWYSHMGWILRDYESGKEDFSNVKDLLRDPIVVWQHKYYLQLAVITNVGFPLILGWIHGEFLGVFLLATILRIVLNHHFTFFINSLAHIWGSQPFSNANSSRDNFFLAFLTYGEGYHNYHHKFQYDYRNGVKWWQFDPTKWLIKTLSWVHLTSHLKMTTKLQIEKARLTMQFHEAMGKLEHLQEADQWRQKLEEGYQQFVLALEEWSRFQQEWYQEKKREFQEKLEKVDLLDRYAELQYNLKLQQQKWRILTTQIA